ncbi:type IV-A pilus assembly ATPase PilB [Desulforhopalus vacuolatus]|uniref:type IV-A pilus assembly ATPase PilB n=1 Tax=Desulforhopalus vacuolatus TaxID=40414 RepID=UPI001962C48A|nr:type IV-A pilus assembly ATPase PilB [Desulforhopalus vacuolatus]MBM9519063.1 type IV-A pilus assembly ATPase PilB [Desulforhopalus vacuolatus]
MGIDAGAKRGPRKRVVRDQSGAGKLKIGEMLGKAGYITPSQMDEAKKILNREGGHLGSILRRLDYIDDDTVFNFLSRQNFPPVTLDREVPSASVLKLFPWDLAKKYMAFPLRITGNTLQVTMAEPCDIHAVEAMQEAVHMDIAACVSLEQDIIDACIKHYKIDSEEAKALLGGFRAAEIDDEDEITEVEDFGSIVAEAADDFEIDSGDQVAFEDQFNASDAPIIKLVNGILIKAVQDGVSDIHIEPYEKSMQVRYRKDGLLFKSMNLPLTIKNALVARMKILARLDITERRIPQDGRIKMRMGKNRSVDFRVSSLPTLWGESVVMRILDKSSLSVDLTKLGFEPETFEKLTRCLNNSQGLLLVTGPTGSGKTVTLYSALNSRNSEDLKILTAEDPVEFNFKGINQVNVQQDVGMTFAAALKAFLRQDPDIIMVGEIRDYDTAEIAIRAAMTGHLVFSTLHTNNSPATIGRLVDIGIPPYMLASSLTMVLSQRLGRRLCSNCKQEVHYEKEELLHIGFKEKELDTLKIYGPKGCTQCNGVGYKGRVGFFELMEITEEVSKAINASVPEDQLRKVAVKEGMIPLREAALEKVRQGITSVEEALHRTTAYKESLPAYLVNPDEEHYEEGDIILREGNTDIDFFKLIRGGLSVVKGGKKIAEITELGDYFGEMAAITGEERTASIISMGRSTVKRYPGNKLEDLIEKYPDVSRHIFASLSKRLHNTNQIVLKLAGNGRRPPGAPAGGRPRPQGYGKPIPEREG